MGYNTEPGDRIAVEYESDDGAEREVEGVVKYDTTQNDPGSIMGSPKAKLLCGPRQREVVLLFPDGSLKRKPRFDGNGSHEKGTVTDLTHLAERAFDAIGPDGDDLGTFATSAEALDEAGQDGHIEAVEVEPGWSE